MGDYDRAMDTSRAADLVSAFAPIPGGWFTMGTERGQDDERPPHRVFVDPFELGVYPVTRAYYSRSPERNPAGADSGVRRVSRGGAWRHATTMCRVTLRSK